MKLDTKKLAEINKEKLFGIFCLLLFVVFLGAISTHDVISRDILWHVKAGDFILANGYVPKTDIFSHSLAGRAWINTSWLAQVIFALFYRVGGLGLLVHIKTLLIVCAILPAVFSTFINRLPYKAIMLLAGVAVGISAYHRFILRPLNFSFLFISLYLFILLKERRGKTNLIYLIPFIQLLWVNMHGLFPLGVFLLAVFVLEVFFEKYFLNKKVARSIKFWSVFILIVVAIQFINPYGHALVFFPFKFLGNTLLKDFVMEWAGPNFYFFSNPTDMMSGFGVWFLVLMTLGSFILQRRRPRLFEIVVYIVATILLFTAIRHIEFYILVALYFLSNNMKNYFFAKEELNKSMHRAVSLFSVVVILLAIYMCVSNKFYKFAHSYYLFGGTEINKVEPPVRCERFIRDVALKGNMYNEYRFGGYLIFKGHKVFIDGRMVHYGEDFYINAVRKIERGNDKQIEAVVEKYGIEYFVMRPFKARPLFRYLEKSENWKTVYFDTQCRVVLKVGGLNDYIIDKYSIDNKERFDYLVANAHEKISVLDEIWPYGEKNLYFYYDSIGKRELAKLELERGLAKVPNDSEFLKLYERYKYKE